MISFCIKPYFDTDWHCHLLSYTLYCCIIPVDLSYRSDIGSFMAICNSECHLDPITTVYLACQWHRLLWPKCRSTDCSTASVNSREGCVMNCRAKFINNSGCLPFARSPTKPVVSHFHMHMLHFIESYLKLNSFHSKITLSMHNIPKVTIICGCGSY